MPLDVGAFSRQQYIHSLETENRIKKWILVPSNAVLVTRREKENRVCAHARRQ